MKTPRCSVLVGFTLALLLGCGKKASEEIDFGSFAGSTYTNKFFALSITMPAGWNVQDPEALKRMTSEGLKAVAGNDRRLARAAELQSVSLFAVFEHPVGAPVEYNPGIVATAERVSHMPGIRNGKDYLFHARKLLGAGQLSVTFPKEVYAEQLGGVEFHVLTAQIVAPGHVVTQQYHAAVMKGYALGFVISYQTDAQRVTLESVLNTVAFAAK